MKTQIITLEAHDDVVSARDRMSWAKSPRILLVWPGFEKVALRPVDLRVLQQHAQYLGADLGLVTRRADVRRDAQGFGIPVFRSTTEAQRQTWPAHVEPLGRRRLRRPADVRELRAMRDLVREKGARWKSRPVVRIGLFIVGVLAVLAIASLFVPRATIRLSPTSMEQRSTLLIEASASNRSVSISGSVPSYQIVVTVSGTQSAKTTSQAKVPLDKAKGIVRFQNLTQAPVVIPAGTVVHSVTPEAARFATLNDTRLDGKVNAFVEVPIKALQAGEGGNVPANVIQAIEGGLGASASATNPEPTTGGSDQNAIVPSDGDRARLRDALLHALETGARQQLASSIAEQDALLPNTVKAATIQRETYDPSAGQPGSLLTLTMQVDFEAEYVKAEDLKQLAEATLNASLPAGYRAAPNSLQFKLGSAPTSGDSGVSRFDLGIQRTILRELDVARAGSLVRGLAPAAASQLLQSSLPLASPPEIRMSPSWWPWLPLIPFRIIMSAP
jgi:hypothetical protein